MTIRWKTTHAEIKKAFIRMLDSARLEDIAMAQLARNADISRSTLYSHFSNTREIFTEIVSDFCRDLRPIDTHLHCSECLDGLELGRPLCLAIRDAGEYQALVKDPSFLEAILAIADELDSAVGGMTAPAGHGQTDKTRQALTRFQISGCYSAAMGEYTDDEWSRIQKTLDAFIRSGKSATRRGA